MNRLKMRVKSQSPKTEESFRVSACYLSKWIPQADGVICSDSVLGYFRQFIERKAYILQMALPWASNFSQGHTFGSLQQAPQRRHWPLRFFETGKKAVTVRLNLAAHVFFEDGFASVIAMVEV
jgi:hypothetical protein